MFEDTQPPAQVWKSFYLYIGTVIVSILDFVLQGLGYTVQNLKYMSFVYYLAGTAITLGIFWFILKRKNWARILYAGLTILSIPIALSVLAKEVTTDKIGAISSTLQLTLGVVSAYMLFVNKSNEWFKAGMSKKVKERYEKSDRLS